MIPMRRYWSNHDEVDNVCLAGSVAWDGKEMLVNKCVTDVSSSCNVETRQGSATEFSLPFLSLISKSNSWRSSTHYINHGLASFLESKYFKAAWLV